MEMRVLVHVNTRSGVATIQTTRAPRNIGADDHNAASQSIHFLSELQLPMRGVSIRAKENSVQVKSVRSDKHISTNYDTKRQATGPWLKDFLLSLWHTVPGQVASCVSPVPGTTCPTGNRGRTVPDAVCARDDIGTDTFSLQRLSGETSRDLLLLGSHCLRVTTSDTSVHDRLQQFVALRIVVRVVVRNVQPKATAPLLPAFLKWNFSALCSNLQTSSEGRASKHSLESRMASTSAFAALTRATGRL
jgi:hypothetical protein